ncbi:MAG: iron-containing alcohol dehydrogenase [Elusimicrobiota bacterium]
MTQRIYRYGFPTEIHFGAGSRKLLTEKLAELGSSRPLVVTDKTVARLGFFKEIVKLAPGSAVYRGVEGNPVGAQVAEGTKAYMDHGADSLVAVGGGAAIDVAKAVAVTANHPGSIFDYEDGVPGQKPIDGEVPAIVAIPTTAGTGSEVGRSTVISADDTKRKKIIFSPKLMPRIVLMDPELTVGLPAGVTAATGMDALSHLVEAYLTPADYNPLCDGIALEGLRLVAKSLAKCVRTPGDLEARGDMMNAALMGAVAFQKGLGAVHSCAHSLSTVVDLHHGLGIGIMLPYVMEFNQPAVPEKFDIMARTVRASDFVGWLKGLKEVVGIPKTLGPAGVKAEHIGPLVEVAVKDVCHPLNPRPVTEEDFRRLFEKALSG